MFDIGWSELLVIGIVALIAIGPKELPGVLRTTGQWMGKIRRMASEFQDQFREAMREAEMEDLKKKVDDVTSGGSNLTDFDPIGSVRNEFEKMVGDDPTKDKPGTAPETPAQNIQPVSPETSEAVAPMETNEAAAPTPPPVDGRKTGEGA